MKSTMETCQVRDYSGDNSTARDASTAVAAPKNAYALANSLGVFDFFTSAILTEENREGVGVGKKLSGERERDEAERVLNFSTPSCDPYSS